MRSRARDYRYQFEEISVISSRNDPLLVATAFLWHFSMEKWAARGFQMVLQLSCASSITPAPSQINAQVPPKTIEQKKRQLELFVQKKVSELIKWMLKRAFRSWRQSVSFSIICERLNHFREFDSKLRKTWLYVHNRWSIDKAHSFYVISLFAILLNACIFFSAQDLCVCACVFKRQFFKIIPLNRKTNHDQVVEYTKEQEKKTEK